MAVRQITIFGGSGFIGRYFVQRLAKRGWIIRVAVRRPNDALFLRTHGHVGQIVPLAASVTHRQSVVDAVAGSDAVANLVGVLYQRGRRSFQAVHVEGARNVAEAARAAGAQQLLHLSALGASRDSRSEYARTKALGEEAVRAAFPAATILRPSVVFGAEDQFFNRFARLARISPMLPLIGGGKTKFQPVYVGDVADAMAAVMEREEARGRTYELTGPRTYTMRELMEFVLRATGRHRPLVSIPWGLASFKAALLELLPVPPLTRDQVKMLRQDNVATGGSPGLRELGVQATAAELVVPAYMDPYRRGGYYTRPAE